MIKEQKSGCNTESLQKGFFIMSVSITDEVLMKKIFKEAVSEFFQEHREWFSEMISEAVEDIAMCNAIREGEKGEFVSRDEIFKFLEMNE